MWLPAEVVDAVDRVAHIKRVTSRETKRWNKARSKGELVAYCGWYWESKNHRSYRQGFGSKGQAYKDAWHELVQRNAAPRVDRPRLKVAA